MTESTETYAFHYSDGEDRTVSLSFAPGYTWTEVLGEFLGFMGTVYGYDIREKVAVKESPFFDKDTWSGPVFNPEDSM